MTSIFKNFLCNIDKCFVQSCFNPNNTSNISSCRKKNENKGELVFSNEEKSNIIVKSKNNDSPKRQNISVFSPRFKEETPDSIYNEERAIEYNEIKNELKLQKKGSKKLEIPIAPRKFSEFTFKNAEVSINITNDSSATDNSGNSSKNQNINYNQIDIFSENDKKNGKKLKLTVIFDLKKDEIGDLFFKKILLINVAGLENGLRDKRDGYSYFGLKHIEGDKIVNDFIVNHKNDSPNQQGSLFYILYRKKYQKYYLKLKQKSDKNMIYVKIESKYEIKGKTFFLICDTLFYFESKTSKNINKATLEFFSKNSMSKFEFNSAESPVTIGRKNCKINLNSSNNISKYQCTIIFENNKWYISDGDMEKPSRNGTWLLVFNKYEIVSTTRMKIGTNVIKIEIL